MDAESPIAAITLISVKRTLLQPATAAGQIGTA